MTHFLLSAWAETHKHVLCMCRFYLAHFLPICACRWATLSGTTLMCPLLLGLCLVTMTRMVQFKDAGLAHVGICRSFELHDCDMDGKLRRVDLSTTERLQEIAFDFGSCSLSVFCVEARPLFWLSLTIESLSYCFCFTSW